jgi:hypothetical protein
LTPVRLRALKLMLIALAVSVVPVVPALAQDPPAPQSETSAASGGSEYGTDPPAETPTVPGTVAKIIDGVAYAPQSAPDAIKQLIWAGNDIVGMPYLYGGGHNEDFEDEGYDCSGTVSYALHGADLLAKPRDSSSFFRYGSVGKGSWVSIYTKSSHMYLTVAGIRLDTSAADDPGGLKGPRWRPLRKTDRGYKARHPVGL